MLASEGEDRCGQVGWWKPSPYQALKLICGLVPDHADPGNPGSEMHETVAPDLATGDRVVVMWSSKLPRKPPA